MLKHCTKFRRSTLLGVLLSVTVLFGGVQAQQGAYANGGFEPSFQNAPRNSYENQYGQGISRSGEPGVWVAENEGKNWRSKSDVMREAKRRYDARVLKITLNEKRGVYKVRLLMPSGKVRVVSVNARR